MRLVVATLCLAGACGHGATRDSAQPDGGEADAAERDGAHGLPPLTAEDTCIDRAPSTTQDPTVLEGSGLQGAIASLSQDQRTEFCAWLWALPDYGAYYCCSGVNKPLRVAVQHESNAESCVDDLAIFANCPDVRIEAYEQCAVAKLSRYCGTPLGCSALSNEGQTAVCLAR